MLRSLYIASTGMEAQQLNVDTIAHNISNVNTNGFKKTRIEFQDLLYQNIKRPSANIPSGLDIGMGVKPATTYTLFSQGNLTPTQNPTDVAIVGNGFFRLEGGGSDENLFTKDGAIKVDGEGNLVNADGFKYAGAEQIDSEGYDVAIGKDGTITYKTADGGVQEAGKLEVFKFLNPAGMEKLGGNLYKATDSSGEGSQWDSESDSTIKLEGQFLESSNVQIVDEMVNLITAQRAYEVNSKVIQSSDEMLQTATNLRR